MEDNRRMTDWRRQQWARERRQQKIDDWVEALMSPFDVIGAIVVGLVVGVLAALLIIGAVVLRLLPYIIAAVIAIWIARGLGVI